jgi:hypothetical protein
MTSNSCYLLRRPVRRLMSRLDEGGSRRPGAMPDSINRDGTSRSTYSERVIARQSALRISFFLLRPFPASGASRWLASRRWRQRR